MCIFTHPMLNENIWSWVDVGVSVFLFGFFDVCIAAFIKLIFLELTTEIHNLSGIMSRFMQFNCCVTKP